MVRDGRALRRSRHDVRLDADAEAWVYVGAALLLSFADRLGGLLGDDDLAAIARERGRWLTGTA